jgi:hypothetical protein
MMVRVSRVTVLNYIEAVYETDPGVFHGYFFLAEWLYYWVGRVGYRISYRNGSEHNGRYFSDVH